jgi:hypothetical protein
VHEVIGPHLTGARQRQRQQGWWLKNLPSPPLSRFLANSHIVGRIAGDECEHQSPTFTTAATSRVSYAPPSQGSTTFYTSPAVYHSYAHSASTVSSDEGARLDGAAPGHHLQH